MCSPGGKSASSAGPGSSRSTGRLSSPPCAETATAARRPPKASAMKKVYTKRRRFKNMEMAGVLTRPPVFSTVSTATSIPPDKPSNRRASSEETANGPGLFLGVRTDAASSGQSSLEYRDAPNPQAAPYGTRNYYSFGMRNRPPPGDSSNDAEQTTQRGGGLINRTCQRIVVWAVWQCSSHVKIGM